MEEDGPPIALPLRGNVQLRPMPCETHRYPKDVRVKAGLLGLSAQSYQ